MCGLPARYFGAERLSERLLTLSLKAIRLEPNFALDKFQKGQLTK